MSDKIPVLLVTGFLGSGKTTLLRHIASEHPDWHMVFLVNEFADTSVDALTLATTGTPTQSVVGGSLFCECKAGEFVRTMQEQVWPQHQQNPLDAVVIETSGIADPEAIGELMSLHGLSEQFEIQRIICVVAAGRFLSLFENLPSVRSQIHTSDLIIINKSDLVGAASIQAVESVLQRENPTAEIVRSQHCQVPLDWHRTLRDLPRRALFTCDANPFSTETITWPEQRSIESARNWLAGLPPSILRIKGTLHTPEGNWQVQRTVDSLEIKPGAASEAPALVLIAHDEDEADLQAAVDSLNL